MRLLEKLPRNPLRYCSFCLTNQICSSFFFFTCPGNFLPFALYFRLILRYSFILSTFSFNTVSFKHLHLLPLLRFIYYFWYSSVLFSEDLPLLSSMFKSNCLLFPFLSIFSFFYVVLFLWRFFLVFSQGFLFSFMFSQFYIFAFFLLKFLFLSIFVLCVFLVVHTLLLLVFPIHVPFFFCLYFSLFL